jgi:hypothetical protein
MSSVKLQATSLPQLSDKLRVTERKNMIRIYELSLGQNAETNMTTIVDHKTNTIIAEFDDYDMALYFLNKCFKLILKDVNRDGWLYTLKQATGKRKEEHECNKKRQLQAAASRSV